MNDIFNYTRGEFRDPYNWEDIKIQATVDIELEKEKTPFSISGTGYINFIYLNIDGGAMYNKDSKLDLHIDVDDKTYTIKLSIPEAPWNDYSTRTGVILGEIPNLFYNENGPNFIFLNRAVLTSAKLATGKWDGAKEFLTNIPEKTTMALYTPKIKFKNSFKVRTNFIKGKLKQSLGSLYVGGAVFLE